MIRRRGEFWHAVWREGGRRVERSLRTSDEGEARELETALMSALRARRKAASLESLMRPPGEPRRRGAAAPSASLAMSEAVEVGRRHRALGAEHEREWGRLREAVGVRLVSELTPSVCLDYMDSHFGGRSAKRYNNVLTLLNTVCRSCLVEAGLDASPFASLMPRRGEAEHYRQFSRDEISRIFDALSAHPRWRLLSLIAMHTGLRLESCRRLSPSMVSDGMITIMPGKTARFGRSVQIPLTAALAEELAAVPVPSPDAPYCEAYPDEPYLTVGGVTRAFYSRLLDSLGIADTDEGGVGFHSWRVTYVSRLSGAGVDDRVIRGIVGHASQRMTDLYNHDTESARRARGDIERALEE